MLGTILLVILILCLIGAVPVGPAPWAANWGWGPGGVVGLILVIVLILMLAGRI